MTDVKKSGTQPPQYFQDFDLAASKHGSPCATRKGNPVVLFKWDCTTPHTPIMGYYTDSDGHEHPYLWGADGRAFPTLELDSRDLVMIPVGECEGKPVFYNSPLRLISGATVQKEWYFKVDFSKYTWAPKLGTLQTHMIPEAIRSAFGMEAKEACTEVMQSYFSHGLEDVIEYLWAEFPDSMRKSVPKTEKLHPDDADVNAFAAAMKAKMYAKSQQGRSGWRVCPAPDLVRALYDHVVSGDPVDVANYCMMLHVRGEKISDDYAGVNHRYWIKLSGTTQWQETTWLAYNDALTNKEWDARITRVNPASGADEQVLSITIKANT